MKTSKARKTLNNMPKENRIFANKYADMVVLINSVLKSKGYSKKRLADNLDKKPPEISRLLNSGKNLTLMTVCKLEAALGVDIINIPTPKVINSGGRKLKATVYINRLSSVSEDDFIENPRGIPINNFERIAI